MQKPKKKGDAGSGKAGLLKSVISNAINQGKEMSIENASEFIETPEETEKINNIKSAKSSQNKLIPIQEEPAQKLSENKEGILAPEKKIRNKKEELKEITKAKASYDLSISNINQVKRLKHWDRYPSEGAVIDFILAQYFKKNPQDPIS